MHDVLLINPPMKSPEAQAKFNNYCPPLGLGYLASNLLKNGISVKILDLNFSDNIYDDLKNNLSKKVKFLVGITTLTQNYSLSIKIARMIKEISPNCFIVFGGPHVTYTPNKVLKEKIIDAVVLYEGEEAIVEIYKNLESNNYDFSNIKGLVFRHDRDCITNPIRPLNENLDSLPYPARQLLPMFYYDRPGTIISSRGCPKKCIFCISSTFEGKYRVRSAENVIEEMKMMHYTWGIREYYFIDNVFTVSKNRVYEICDLIRKNLKGIFFICVSRADLITLDLVKNLKSAGCRRIEIGVESGVQKNINYMKKSLTLEQVKNAANIVLGEGLIPMFTFQIGSPYDNIESIKKTIKLAAHLRSQGATTLFSIMTPYPGTPLVINTEKYGINIMAKEWYDYRTSNPVYDTAYAKRNDFRKALYYEYLSQSNMETDITL